LSGRSERKKKATSGFRAANSPDSGGLQADSLETFFERLRDLCQNHGGCLGQGRPERTCTQTEQAIALAAELGILKQPCMTWPEFLALCPEARIGTEHVVELDAQAGIVGKTTIPPAFGLIPDVRKIPLAVLQPDSGQSLFREAIEFVKATPLEYLSRWIASNDVFGDDVQLASVIQWADGLVSFGITQPQYHGTPAEPRQIEQFFRQAGWTHLKDPSGHAVFFNHAFGVLAIDAERRNCFVNEGGLQPFDVILHKPDESLERFLQIYPG